MTGWLMDTGPIVALLCADDEHRAWVDAGFLRSGFDFGAEHSRVGELMRRYRDQPMAFADACLVRMAEMHSDSCIWTLDSDFQFYRKAGHRSISVVAPWYLTSESPSQLLVNGQPVSHSHQPNGACFLVNGVNNAKAAGYLPGSGSRPPTLQRRD